jgi:long-chain acyl-CoA synthetase
MFKDFDSYSNIPAVFFEMADENPDQVVYLQAQINSESDDNGLPRKWKSTTYAQAKERVLKIAGYLDSIGIGKGSKVAILSNTRPEWVEADLAILSLGAIEVSIYQSFRADDVGYIIFDSETEVIFAENQEQLDKLTGLMEESFEVPGHEDREPAAVNINLKKIITFEETEDREGVIYLEQVLGSAPLSESADKLLQREDLASFVYTSGTTGPPKGVMQTHGNHLANIRQALNSEFVKDDSTIMLFLPLAHSFARLMGYLGLLTPATLKFPAICNRKTSRLTPESVTRDIREGSATLVPIVPRILEKMQSGVLAKASRRGLLPKILKLTLWSAQEAYKARQAGANPRIRVLMGFEGTGAIRQKIREQLFGPDFAFGISGGAKLNEDVARFFDSLGIEIMEGYGLTETCVATNINRAGKKKIGTVGPLLDQDIELRIAEDGEILFRGPNVTRGYYKRETATRDAWDEEGWFHTGDLGEVDEDGYLSIKGRKKEILVTSNGKNIAPEPIEQRLSNSEYIAQVILVGDSRPYCTALVTLDVEAVNNWAERMGINLEESISGSEKVRELIQAEVDKVNQALAHHEHVREIAILPDQFTIENGLLTPTFKVKRNCVVERYQDRIENLYREQG